MKVSPNSEGDSDTESPTSMQQPKPAICGAYGQFSKASWVILAHEFLERFSYYGVASIVTIFLATYLEMSDNLATCVYHIFSAVSYLSPLLGAILSDNYWGRYKTIVIMGLLYLAGFVLLTVSTVKRNLPGPIIGLLVLAVGGGSIKACVAAFGGDQIAPGRIAVLDSFFSLFYLAINIGAVTAQLTIPMLKSNIDCVDGVCYPAAYGVSAVAFLVTYLLFLAGSRWYVKLQSEESVITKTWHCMIYCMKKRLTLHKTERRDSFLDYGVDIYTRDFLDGIKKVLSITLLFVPFPIFWAVFYQQGSRWTLQASQMDGFITNDVKILPSQVQLFNPFFILFAIPLFNNVIYPLLLKCNLCTQSTTRIFYGYLFAAGAFVCSGVVQLKINSGLPHAIPSTQWQARFANPYECSIFVDISATKFQLSPNGVTGLHKLQADSSPFIANISRVDGCKDSRIITKTKPAIKARAGEISTALIFVDSTNSYAVETLPINRTVLGGSGLVRVVSLNAVHKNVTVRIEEGDEQFSMEMHLRSPLGLPMSKYNEITNGRFQVKVEASSSARRDGYATGWSSIGEVNIDVGQTSTIVLYKDIDKNDKVILIEEQQLYLVKVYWQIPQYIMLTCGELLFSVTAMTFAYSEAPASMKALLQAVYLVTIALGNIIVAIVVVIPGDRDQAWEFFIFAMVVILSGLLYAILAWRYNRKKSLDESGRKDTVELHTSNSTVVDDHTI